MDLQARIRLRYNGSVIETTVGRTLLNDVVPEPLRFINKELKKKEIGTLIGECYNRLGNEVTVAFLDDLKDIGFKWATRSGVTVSIDDVGPEHDHGHGHPEHADPARATLVRCDVGERERVHGEVTPLRITRPVAPEAHRRMPSERLDIK